MKDFDINKFYIDVPISHVIPGKGLLKTSRGDVHALSYCLFYCLPRKYLELYYYHFKAWLFPDTTEPVEHIFTMFLQSLRRVETIDKLHIHGYGAAKGDYVLL